MEGAIGAAPQQVVDLWPLASDMTDDEAAKLLAGADSGIRPDLSRYGYRFAKRVFDIVASGAAIALLFVPSIALSAAICIKSPGAGPFYSQVRVGRLRRDGTYRLFRMWKFRSMVPNADQMLEELKERNEADGPLFKIKDDPRIIPGIGHFIRRHSMARTIIGTPGVGEPTNSLSSAAKTSLEQQLYEWRPEVISCDSNHYTSSKKLSVAVFGAFSDPKTSSAGGGARHELIHAIARAATLRSADFKRLGVAV